MGGGTQLFGIRWTALRWGGGEGISVFSFHGGGFSFPELDGGLYFFFEGGISFLN